MIPTVARVYLEINSKNLHDVNQVNSKYDLVCNVIEDEGLLVLIY